MIGGVSRVAFAPFGAPGVFLQIFAFFWEKIHVIWVSLQRVVIELVRTFNAAMETANGRGVAGCFCMIIRREWIRIFLNRGLIPHFQAAHPVGRCSRKDMSIGSLVELREMRNESRRNGLYIPDFQKSHPPAPRMDAPEDDSILEIAQNYDRFSRG